jgi:hypothetical protein
MTNAELARHLFEYTDRLPYAAHVEVTRVFHVTYGVVYALHRGLVLDVTPEGREWMVEMLHDLNAGWTSCSGQPDEVVVPPAEPKLPVPAE